MRRSIAVVLLVAWLAPASACSRPSTQTLARTTSFALAREHGRRVTVDGMAVFSITLGKGRDVVLLHGDPSSTYTWRKVIEPLSRRYRVHAIDLPGYGFSDKPAKASYDTAWLARIVVGYLDAVGVERAVLVGNSMGGYVASEAAILYPERVAGLVLIAAAGLEPEGAAGEPELPLTVRMASLPGIGAVVRALPSRAAVAYTLEKAVYDGSTVTDEDVDAYYLPLRTKNGWAAFLRRATMTIEPERGDLVAAIRTPTLVLTGDSDRLVSPSIARSYHELIAGSRLVVLERTGHLPQEEQPQRTVEEIVAFLDGMPD